MDAMSDAIEGADVMLYGVSLRYKESANVRKAPDTVLSIVQPQSLLLTSCVLPRVFLSLRCASLTV